MTNHSSSHQPHPDAHRAGWSIVMVAIILVATLAFRIALPGLVRDYLNNEPADLDVDLTELNSLTRAYGNIDFESGMGSLVMELHAEDAQLTGYVKPLLDQVEILDIEESTEERGVLGTVWEGVVAGLGWDHPEDRLDAQIEIQGTLDQRDVSSWQAFVSVLRNAFVEAYDVSFGRD